MKKTKILFVCLGNTCRSQMAEGFAKAYAPGRFSIKSAGTLAYGEVIEPTIDVMRERGIDLSDHTSDQLTDTLVYESDILVSMAPDDMDRICPKDYAGQKIKWKVIDPYGSPFSVYRNTRDDIEKRVKELISALT